MINDVEVDIHDFSQFLINPTKHRLVPKHTILSNTEKARVLAELRVTEAQIPLIQTSDPIMRWYDAKPGDLIRITRTSGSAGNISTTDCATKRSGIMDVWSVLCYICWLSLDSSSLASDKRVTRVVLADPQSDVVGVVSCYT